MDNKEKKEQDEYKVTIAANTSEEGKKLIEDTYNLYTSQSVTIEEQKAPARKPGTAPLVRKVTGELKDPSKVKSENIVTTSKIVYKEINSVSNLNTDLQEQVKKAMNGENKEKIKEALKEIEIHQDNFFTQEGNVFDDLSKDEVKVVEKKIAEMKVNKEITEINVSAIISCIDNLKTKKK